VLAESGNPDFVRNLVEKTGGTWLNDADDRLYRFIEEKFGK
jgi:hypothetical protein